MDHDDYFSWHKSKEVCQYLYKSVKNLGKNCFWIFGDHYNSYPPPHHPQLFIIFYRNRWCCHGCCAMLMSNALKLSPSNKNVSTSALISSAFRPSPFSSFAVNRMSRKSKTRRLRVCSSGVVCVLFSWTKAKVSVRKILMTKGNKRFGLPRAKCDELQAFKIIRLCIKCKVL